VTTADSAKGSRLRRGRHPLVGLALGCLAGLLPFLGPPAFPQSLDPARWVCLALAGGAAAFVMRRSRPRGTATLLLRKRLVLLLVTSLPILFLLYGFRVVRIETGKGPVVVPLGFWRKPHCRKADEDEFTWVRRELVLDEGAIRYCWGDGPVNTVRSGLVLSLWGTALACGGLIGLLLVGEKWYAEASVEREGGPAATPSPSYDLFLSYSTKDQDFVQRLAGDLEEQDIAVWWDQQEVQTGASFVASIGEGLMNSRRFAVVLSPESVGSPWVNEEINTAIALEKGGKERFVIPLLYQNCEIPALLTHRRYIDFRGELYEQGLEKLLAELRRTALPEGTG